MAEEESERALPICPVWDRSQELGTASTQLLELSLLPFRTCVNRKLRPRAKARFNCRYSNVGDGVELVPKSSHLICGLKSISMSNVIINVTKVSS